MKKEDELLKCYLSDDERYADLINGVSFGGRQVVRADDLSDRDTQTGYHKNTRTVKGKKNTKYRDLFRKASFGANFAVVGVENQTQVHYLMPVRCMEYDVKEYRRQEVEQKKILERLRKQAEEKDRYVQKKQTDAEFLSGFPKEGKLNPCITIVLYYGDNWDGSTDLYGLLDFKDIPKELRGMVNNYKLNLVDIKKLEQTDMFHTDLKQVFDFIRYANNKEKLKELVENDSAYTSMREDAYDVIATFTKSKELVKIKEERGWKGEKHNMCQALREWADDERKEGKIEGKIEGKKEGRLEEKLENLCAIMINLKLTEEKAMDALNIPQEERSHYMELLSML